MTAANKYPCRLDRTYKDYINDPLEAKGGKVRNKKRKRERGWQGQMQKKII